MSSWPRTRIVAVQLSTPKYQAAKSPSRAGSHLGELGAGSHSACLQVFTIPDGAVEGAALVVEARIRLQSLMQPECGARSNLESWSLRRFRQAHPYMMQGCHTPPPPPHPMVSPLACQVGSCLVWPCCFPRLVLFGLVPSPSCGVGPVVFLVGPAPPVGGSVFYRGSTEVWYGCCRLLVVLSSLRPLPPCGVGQVVVLVGPAPPVWGSVSYRVYRDMVWLLACSQ